MVLSCKMQGVCHPSFIPSLLVQLNILRGIYLLVYRDVKDMWWVKTCLFGAVFSDYFSVNNEFKKSKLLVS